MQSNIEHCMSDHSRGQVVPYSAVVLFCPICVYRPIRVYSYGTPIRVWDNILSHMSMSYIQLVSQLASCVFYFACYTSLHAGVQLATVGAAATVAHHARICMGLFNSPCIRIWDSPIRVWDCPIRVYCSCGMHIHMEQSHTRMHGTIPYTYTVAVVQQLQYICVWDSPYAYAWTIEQSHAWTIKQSHAYTMQHELPHMLK